jgi:hypothetical protein
MCDRSKVVAALSKADYELREKIIRDIGTFTVPLFKVVGKAIELAGTGTLIAIRGSHYILIAAHVWHEKLRSADKIGIGIQENIANGFFALGLRLFRVDRTLLSFVFRTVSADQSRHVVFSTAQP